jgi:anthranilate synthase/aminodeoxychorismate synthase-like glutamine amidotransferase
VEAPDLILVVDNYDSFTFNLVQYIGELGADPDVYRNDALSVDEIRALKPNGIIISPGPGRPEDAGISIEVVQKLTGEIPILGVCLGHQAIAVAHGGSVGRAPRPIHGKTARVQHNGDGLFEGVEDGFEAGRYHSLVVAAESLSEDFEVSATTLANESDPNDDAGLVMALRHREHHVYGVQFHPESILTEGGQTLLKNFLKICGEIT